MRDEKREAAAGSEDEAENRDGDGDGETSSSRAVVALRLDNCGILIGWGVGDVGGYSSVLYAAC